MGPSAEQFEGCLLGLALGDALGAPHEGGPVERALWRLIGTTRSGRRRYTDDTQMSLDLAESLVERKRFDAEDVAIRFARSYRWSRGYGPGASRLLKRIRAGVPWRKANRSVYPAGSFGNGGAMRAPVVGLFCWRDRDRLLDAARRSAEITHAHPLGVEGALSVAAATSTALATRDWRSILGSAAAPCGSSEFVRRFSTARKWLEASVAPPPNEVRVCLGTGITATESCVTAVYVGLRFVERPFSDLLAFVADCGGDVDTVGAMAGAVWGACNGARNLPERALDSLEDRERIASLAISLHSVASPASTPGLDSSMG